VHFIRNGIDMSIWRALSTRRGLEKVTESDF
jgi:hypothetical protein